MGLEKPSMSDVAREAVDVAFRNAKITAVTIRDLDERERLDHFVDTLVHSTMAALEWGALSLNVELDDEQREALAREAVVEAIADLCPDVEPES